MVHFKSYHSACKESTGFLHTHTFDSTPLYMYTKNGMSTCGMQNVPFISIPYQEHRWTPKIHCF